MDLDFDSVKCEEITSVISKLLQYHCQQHPLDCLDPHITILVNLLYKPSMILIFDLFCPLGSPVVTILSFFKHLNPQP